MFLCLYYIYTIQGFYFAHLFESFLRFFYFSDDDLGLTQYSAVSE